MRWLQVAMRWLLGIVFLLAGVNHFRNPDFYLRMMPSFLPWHRELVYVSGVLEAVLGALLLIPRYAHLAAWGLIALLVAVFPANLNMALNPDLFPEFSRAAQWARLPMQGVFVAWAYWFTRPLPLKTSPASADNPCCQ